MRHATVFGLLLTFWVVFSGHFDALHLVLGVLSCALVTATSTDLLLTRTPSTRTFLRWWRFAQYVPWLVWQIALANLHVVYLVFRPDRISPRVVRFKTSLQSDIARVALGNSITLTPGTITLDIVEDEFWVHAVSEQSAAGVTSGDMERRVARAFLEPETGPAGGSPEAAG